MTGPAVLDRLAALGDETRARLLLLLESGEFTVSELGRILQTTQPTTSRHLKVLAEDGWVVARQEGTRRPYTMSGRLDSEAEALWAVVRQGVADTESAGEDRERARSVLAARVDRARSFFSETAERWDDLRDDLFGADTAILPYLGLLDPDWTAVDLGCGTGVTAVRCAPFLQNVIGVDRSTEMLSAARSRAAGLEHVRFEAGELTSLPLTDDLADVVFATLVLHYLPEPLAALREAARILRPGGRLIVIDMREHGRTEYRTTMGHQWRGFAEGRMTGWLETAGFDPGPRIPIPPDPSADGPPLFLQVGTRRRSGRRRS